LLLRCKLFCKAASTPSCSTPSRRSGSTALELHSGASWSACCACAEGAAIMLPSAELPPIAPPCVPAFVPVRATWHQQLVHTKATALSKQHTLCTACAQDRAPRQASCSGTRGISHRAEQALMRALQAPTFWRVLAKRHFRSHACYCCHRQAHQHLLLHCSPLRAGSLNVQEGSSEMLLELAGSCSWV